MIVIYIYIEAPHTMEEHQAFSQNSEPKITKQNEKSEYIQNSQDFYQKFNFGNKLNLNNYGPQFHQDKAIQYYNLFFSSKQTAESIKKRNDNLQMMNFQNSEEEPDDFFNRRKKKVSDLITKEEQQLAVLLKIKSEHEGKFLAIICFMEFFCKLKEKLIGTRTDYYSSKTFCALKNSNQNQITELKKVIQKMFLTVMKQASLLKDNSQLQSQNSNKIDERINQFLIIPRFLISRQKIIRLSKDETLQRNFQFLVTHKCLGHYNNQANKKMPEESQMIYVRNLLNKNLGRDKFKKICSINHGNKFLRSYGKDYYQLYFKSLQYLKQLQLSLKKGKKYQVIKKQLSKLPQQKDAGSINSTYTQNQSSNSIYNFKMMDQCLYKIQDKKSDSQIVSEMRDQPAEIQQLKPFTMKKKGIKKLMSMPLNQDPSPLQIQKKFSVKKYQSMQATRTTQNIIIIHPPHHSQM